VQIFACALITVWTSACFAPRDVALVLTADLPLHLEDHVDAAVIAGSEMPVDPPEVVEWRFDEPQPDWRPAAFRSQNPAQVERTADALRVTLGEETRAPDGRFRGAVYVEVPDWHQDAWSEVIVRARTSSNVERIGIVRNDAPLSPGELRPLPWPIIGETSIISDGAMHSYRFPLHTRGIRARATYPWQRLGLVFLAAEPVSIDFLSASVVPTAAMYVDDRLGMASISVGGAYRRSLFTHAPGRVAYRLRVPEGGRIDTALGVLGTRSRVEFRVVAEPESVPPATLLRETYDDEERWAERSVDLSGFAGQTITLALETDSEAPGTVALWGAPTVSGARQTDKPNVVFYIIDGAGADYMSVYGYNRRTTPNLERLAAEGAVFERAYSNSDWTRPSTPSFLTSLQHSVLGGLRDNGNPVPDNILTLAEHLHRAAYQTAEFTRNPNAGSMSNLQRGHDVFRDGWVGGPTPTGYSTSSVGLHQEFWQWREASPGEPYYVHFQTTDVHFEHYPVPPFAGLFISADRRQLRNTWNERLDEARASGATFDESFERTGINRVEYFTAQRDLHDETMAHQDYQLGQLVARLKAQEEWERTLLIVAADHGVAAGASDYGIRMREPPPAEDLARSSWLEGGGAAAMFASGVSRIPMIIVWPGRIAPGQRFSEPVSMIDMLPTILDLVDLPMPEVMQGQSLAPLLLGEPGWEPRPVILDQFDTDGAGRFWGRIEVVDGRWGASLQINHPPDQGRYMIGPRSSPAVLLFDLWTDPNCLHSLHEERPDLVEKYTKFLEEQLEAHLALGRHLTPSEAPPLTPEQLEALRALGYIR
jgi:arylsulfatase A-like enzyme